MDSSILKILRSRRVDSSFCTHQTIFHPKAKYNFRRQDLEEFWTLYCDLIDNKKDDAIVGLAEKPQYFLPVLADIDIKKPLEEGEDVKRIYNYEQIQTTVEIYQSVIRNIVEECNDKHLICLLLEKPPYIKTKGDQDVLCNGFHLHFPYTFLNQADLKVHLIPRIREKMSELNVFEDLNLGDSGDLIDEATYRLPWLLYGGRKSESMDAYMVSKAYGPDGEIGIKEALEQYVIYDNRQKDIVVGEKYEYYLPRILSIVPHGREVCEVKANIPSSLKPKVVLDADKVKYNNSLSVTESLGIAKKVLPLLADFRAEDRNDWMTIGWALYNIGGGCEEARDLWVDFSGRCPDKFSEATCIYEWDRMIKKDLTLGTLRYYASIDNPEEYKKFKQERSERYVKDSLNGSHYHIAKVLFEEYGNEFVCSSITHKRWYRFENHVWKLSQEGIHLRKHISEDIMGRYKQLVDENHRLASEARSRGDMAEAAMYDARMNLAYKIEKNLGSTPFKNNIMKECMEVFYDEDFEGKLDANSYLFAFKNGIIDLKQHTFRPGRPEDYIAKKAAIDYKDYSDGDEEVQDVYDFLEKIFPDKTLRTYFLDISSEVFIGGNFRKIVSVWSGDGNNGKSKTEELFEKMLGSYAIKLPTALITGKRTQSSAACPELARAGNGVRWAVLQEPEKKDVINIGIFKELSGGDTMYVRGMYKDGMEITPQFKIALVCNDPPQVPHADPAFWNRLRILPYESTFVDPEDAPKTYEEQLRDKIFPADPNFSAKIPKMAQPFAWLLLHHLKNSVKSNVEPSKVKLATAKYKRRNDIYRQFIEECIMEIDDDEGRVKVSLQELYTAFREWYKESIGTYNIPIKNDVKEYFERLWGTPEKGCKWLGFRIRTLQDDVDNEEAYVFEAEDFADYDEKNNLPPL